MSNITSDHWTFVRTCGLLHLHVIITEWEWLFYSIVIVIILGLVYHTPHHSAVGLYLVSSTYTLLIIFYFNSFYNTMYVCYVGDTVIRVRVLIINIFTSNLYSARV